MSMEALAPFMGVPLPARPTITSHPAYATCIYCKQSDMVVLKMRQRAHTERWYMVADCVGCGTPRVDVGDVGAAAIYRRLKIWGFNMEGD